ncbi:YusW family protein [Jeotgalicoccus halotolerans]
MQVKKEAIEQVLDVFDLDTNYTEIEIEITFNDGTKIEFEDK